jgi:hypothetical protein
MPLYYRKNPHYGKLIIRRYLNYFQNAGIYKQNAPSRDNDLFYIPDNRTGCPPSGGRGVTIPTRGMPTRRGRSISGAPRSVRSLPITGDRD